MKKCIAEMATVLFDIIPLLQDISLSSRTIAVWNVEENKSDLDVPRT